ncbi:MAG: hypothetical protein WAM97_17045 [Acidimicrobiales bacterium]
MTGAAAREMEQAGQMERYLVIWCPDLLEEKEEGRERRAFEQVVEAVSPLATRIEKVRPGVCAIPTIGPSRYFGGDPSFSLLVARTVEEAVQGTGAGVGVADGLFAAVLAGRTGVSEAVGSAFVVPPGGTPAFLTSWPVGILERDELAELCGRLGIRTLGQFAALPTRHVLARFGTDGVACHRAASGKTGELPGLRVPDPADAQVNGKNGANGPVVRQPGFWGGTAEADVRAGIAIGRIQEELGPEEVLAVRLQGGRSPSERARLVPVDSRVVGTRVDRSVERSLARSSAPRSINPVRSINPAHSINTVHPSNTAPWPGRIPPPSPAVVLEKPVPVTLVDAAGKEVNVSGRVLLSSAPDRISVCGGPWEKVERWAGPWPADERWWSLEHRRRARVQLVTSSGSAQLLVAENGGWWLEGVYD